MPPQLLERSRRRAHNAAPPAASCQPAAHGNRPPPASLDGSIPQQQMDDGRGDEQHSVALSVTTWGN